MVWPLTRPLRWGASTMSIALSPGRSSGSCRASSAGISPSPSSGRVTAFPSFASSNSAGNCAGFLGGSLQFFRHQGTSICWRQSRRFPNQPSYLYSVLPPYGPTPCIQVCASTSKQPTANPKIWLQKRPVLQTHELCSIRLGTPPQPSGICPCQWFYSTNAGAATKTGKPVASTT